jgi:hypothetical protein
MSERETQQGDRETGTCHICEQVFPTQEELSKHLMDAHADDGSPIHQASPRRTEGGDGPKRSGLHQIPRRSRPNGASPWASNLPSQPVLRPGMVSPSAQRAAGDRHRSPRCDLHRFVQVQGVPGGQESRPKQRASPAHDLSQPASAAARRSSCFLCWTSALAACHVDLPR